jgi:hypothetical protein
VDNKNVIVVLLFLAYFTKMEMRLIKIRKDSKRHRGIRNRNFQKLLVSVTAIVYIILRIKRIINIHSCQVKMVVNVIPETS